MLFNKYFFWHSHLSTFLAGYVSFMSTSLFNIRNFYSIIWMLILFSLVAMQLWYYRSTMERMEVPCLEKVCRVEWVFCFQLTKQTCLLKLQIKECWNGNLKMTFNTHGRHKDSFCFFICFKLTQNWHVWLSILENTQKPANLWKNNNPD